jgi:hypothetical protein
MSETISLPSILKYVHQATHVLSVDVSAHVGPSYSNCHYGTFGAMSETIRLSSILKYLYQATHVMSVDVSAHVGTRQHPYAYGMNMNAYFLTDRVLGTSGDHLGIVDLQLNIEEVLMP